MRTAFDDAAVVEHDDLIRMHDGRETMRDHDDRALMRETRERTLDRRLGFVVDGARGFVEQQHRRVLEQGTCDRQALALTTRQLHAALADARVVALRQPQDELVRFGRDGGCDDVGFARAGAAVGDVLAHRAIEQEHVLRDPADLAAQPVQRITGEVAAVETDLSLRGLVEAQQQLDQRRLATAGRTDQRERLSRAYLEIDAAQHLGAVRIRKVEIVDCDVAARRMIGQGLVAVADRDRRGKETQDAPRRGHRTLEQIDRVGESRQRPEQALGQEDEHRIEARLQMSFEHELSAAHEGAEKTEQDGHADQRHEGRAQPDRVAVRRDVGLAFDREPLMLALLGGEAADRRDAGEVVGEPSRQRGCSSRTTS